VVGPAGTIAAGLEMHYNVEPFPEETHLMRVLPRILIAVSFCLPAIVAACSQAPAAQPAAQAVRSPPTAVERGQTLVTVAGCDDCHTPKKMGAKGPEFDMARRLSGYPEGDKLPPPYTPVAGSPWTAATNDFLTAWSGPWGVSFPRNLTPDTLTGLRSGVWTEEVFIKALRTGKHMGTSRDILPPMPWQEIGQLGDDDLKAIWAYLGTIAPVKNQVPDPIDPSGKPIQ